MITLENVSRYYKTKKVITKALDDVSINIEEGKFVVIVGDSGSGKTTMLNLIGGLDQASNGTIKVFDQDITHLKPKELNDYRANVCGIVFQNYNLINNLSVLENILIMKDIKKDIINPLDILDEVGLKHKANNFPLELSGGESQRVAIARALAKKPKLLLCDEPTGALDYDNSKNIIGLLKELNVNLKMTTILVTHNQAFTKIADQVIRLKSGHVIENKLIDNPLPIEELEW